MAGPHHHMSLYLSQVGGKQWETWETLDTWEIYHGTREKTSLLNISNLLRVSTGVRAGQLSTAAGQSAYCLLTMEPREEKAVVE